MKEYRNVGLVLAFLVWCSIQTWMVVRASGANLQEGMITALGIMFTGVGGAVVGAIFGRASHTKAEKK